MNSILKYFTITALLISSCSTIAFSQTTVSGTVYDITRKTPIEAVSVVSTSGRGTSTDSLGKYTLIVNERDSIYFSYLNKATPKYPILQIPNLNGFDISILTRIQELPNVFVKPRNYLMDSLQNRMNYANVFNYQKPGLRTTSLGSPGSVGVGLDINELINMFRFRKNRSMEAFQRRLINEEQDKYVNHRFNKGFIKKLTGLPAQEIDTFIAHYRPPYDLVTQLNELELGMFIQEAYKIYQYDLLRRSSYKFPTPKN